MCRLQLILVCFLSSLVSGQDWDPTYYDKEILYDNEELIQLTPGELLEKKNLDENKNKQNYQIFFTENNIDFILSEYKEQKKSTLDFQFISTQINQLNKKKTCFYN